MRIIIRLCESSRHPTKGKHHFYICQNGSRKFCRINGENPDKIGVFTGYIYFVALLWQGQKDLKLPLRNIVALLAWSASHCSLFLHLTAAPTSAAGGGATVRPGTRFWRPHSFPYLSTFSLVLGAYQGHILLKSSIQSAQILRIAFVGYNERPA